MTSSIDHRVAFVGKKKSSAPCKKHMVIVHKLLSNNFTCFLFSLRLTLLVLIHSSFQEPDIDEITDNYQLSY